MDFMDIIKPQNSEFKEYLSPYIHVLTIDKICQWLATGRWFSMGTSVSSINKTDHHDITEILLKVALNTINQA
jgi:hypothetical protein